jgi:hypothetical protein
VAFGEGRLDFVSDAEIEGKTGNDLPVVLDIAANVVLLGGELGVDSGSAVIVGDSEQVRGEAVALCPR